MPTEKLYEKITNNHWDSIKSAAWGFGIQILGNTGSAESFGVKLGWSYVPASENLAINIKQSNVMSEADALGVIDGIIATSR